MRGVHRRLAAHGDVVAVEGDVDVAERDRLSDQLRDEITKPLGDDGAAAMDPDDGEAASAGLLDDLVRDAHERAPHVLGVEDDLVAHFRSFLASRDRVKGAVRASLAPAYGGTVLWAPRSALTCTGAPRSGKGISTRSKSRGTIVASKTSRASARSSSGG